MMDRDELNKYLNENFSKKEVDLAQTMLNLIDGFKACKVKKEIAFKVIEDVVDNKMEILDSINKRLTEEEYLELLCYFDKRRSLN